MDDVARLERMRSLVRQLSDELDQMGTAADERQRAPIMRELLETVIRPWPGEEISLDYGRVPDAVIAEFMGLMTPVTIPTEFAAARATFMSLAAEAEFVGRRGNGGHCWRVRLGPHNGEFLIWTRRDRMIEKVEYDIDRP